MNEKFLNAKISHSRHPFLEKNNKINQSKANKSKVITDSSSCLSSNLDTAELTLTPQIIFMIKLHSKVLSMVNELTQRLENLEKKADKLVSKRFNYLISSLDSENYKMNKDCPMTSGVNNKVENNKTLDNDEDELLFLLNQIIQHSHEIEKQVQWRWATESSFKAFKSSSTFKNKNFCPLEASLSTSASLLSSKSISFLLLEPDNERFLQNIHQMMENDGK